MVKKALFFSILMGLTPFPLFSQSKVESPEKPGVYVVHKGDCLWKISKEMWGKGYKWPLLFAVNQEKIHNPSLIYAGQQLTIPTTVTPEELKKARELAEARIAPLSAEGEIPPAKAKPKHHAASTAESSSSGTSSRNSASAETTVSAQQAENNSSAPQKQVSPSSESTSYPVGFKVLFTLVGLLALGGLYYFWKRKGASGPSTLQQPRPLSSFPQAKDQPSPSISPAPSAARPSFSTPNPSNQPTPSQPPSTATSTPKPLPSISNPTSTSSPGSPISSGSTIPGVIPTPPPAEKPPVSGPTIPSTKPPQPVTPVPQSSSPSPTSPSSPPANSSSQEPSSPNPRGPFPPPSNN